MSEFRATVCHTAYWLCGTQWKRPKGRPQNNWVENVQKFWRKERLNGAQRDLQLQFWYTWLYNAQNKYTQCPGLTFTIHKTKLKKLTFFFKKTTNRSQQSPPYVTLQYTKNSHTLSLYLQFTSHITAYKQGSGIAPHRAAHFTSVLKSTLNKKASFLYK